MSPNYRRSIATTLFFVACTSWASAQPISKAANGKVFAVYEGSTPNGDSIRKPLNLTPDADSSVRWKLTLYQDGQTSKPTNYELHCEVIRYSPTGARQIPTSIDKTGSWSIRKGAAANPNANVYELDGLLPLVEIDRGLVHMLGADRTLMVGNGGWSYTLNKAGESETPTDPATMNRADLPPYRIAPIAAGPNVYGVFDGRTPFAGIAKELKLGDEIGIKAKWRVTLYQNPETKAPTTYRVEGTLLWRAPREGTWTIERGTKNNPDATVFRLNPADTSEVPIHLLKGDDNVLYFLDQQRQPRIGHAEFSYTLDRRTPPAATPGS